MKIRKRIFVACLVIGVMSSCVSPKKMVYFQAVEGVELNEDIQNYETTIKKADILSIHVSAIDPEAAIPFNLYETASTTNPKPLTYLVDAQGEINFPVLGKLKVEGISTKQLTTNLTAKLVNYLKKPIVNIRLKNFKVSVLGEVKNPGTFPVENERITIIEAISLAGDLTIQGKRADITLIREQHGKRSFIPIDLTSKELFNSPYYYLAQNDVIYVQPNKAKINSSVVGPNTGIIFSSISTLISIIAIITK